jgi:hypothetical protein
MKAARFTCFGLSIAFLSACGGSPTLSPVDTGAPTPDAGGDMPDAGGGGTPDSGDMGMPDSGPAPTITVQFKYQPGWMGVTEVAVVGAFGQATDWMQPLTTLMDDGTGTGTYSGSAALPVGHYTYLFRVKGDVATPKATFMRYAVDPSNPAFEACPQGAPSFSMTVMNPCSTLDLTLGAPTPATLYHVKGTINYDGMPKTGYLVEVERMEMGSHHYFVNRATSAADGTIDLQVATGHYRLQVLYPTFMSQTDDQRDPLTLQAARRAISSAFMVMNDVTVAPAEVAYHTYTQMAPRTSPDTLPTHFSIAVNPGDMGARLDVYGSPVGDPFFASKTSTATAIVFNGMFNTTATKTTSVAIGKKYYWGTEQLGPHPAGQVQWTIQSMVFPITWQ